MKKRIGVIAFDERAAVSAYAPQIDALFGSVAETHPCSVQGGTVDTLGPMDLYVVSTDAFENEQELRRQIPTRIPYVEIEQTFTREAIEKLRAIPTGSRALFVNLSEKMCRECIARINQLGINHIAMTPLWPGKNEPVGYDLAITPAEVRYVPANINSIIDLGHRTLDISAVVEIALKLREEALLETETIQSYFQSICSNSYSFYTLFERQLAARSQLNGLIEALAEGIIGVDVEGNVYICNQKAAQITGVSRARTMECPAADVFPELPFADCIRKRSVLDAKLMKLNGANVNVDLFPVQRGNVCMGAFARLQRFSEEEEKQSALRMQLFSKEHRAKYTFDDIAGESPAICRARNMAQKMAATNGTVCITGETGTGKELFAQAIHNCSPRRGKPFIAVNCAAIPDGLLESELFGYADGAFTGAKKGGKMGLFEFAHGGTLFLDEVEGMSQALQVKLLRVIQEREVMPVGGNRIIQVDVRLICATNEGLEEKVESGEFRADLYYRLCTLPLRLPPLRERREDILLLVDLVRQSLGGTFRLSPTCQEVLTAHQWKGNIRELRNYVEYLVYQDKPIVEPEDLPPTFFRAGAKPDLKSSGLSRAAEIPKEPFPFTDGEEALYRFLLREIGTHQITGVGRSLLLTAARQAGLTLSQYQLRAALSRLEELGYVSISRGRGGCRLSEKGLAAI